MIQWLSAQLILSCFALLESSLSDKVRISFLFHIQVGDPLVRSFLDVANIRDVRMILYKNI